jgi:hypothetical protein
VITMTLNNSGTTANPRTYVSFANLHTNADFQSCKPACERTAVYSDLLLPAVRPYKSLNMTVTWIATKVGVANWTLNVYDDPSSASSPGGAPILSGDATTTVS